MVVVIPSPWAVLLGQMQLVEAHIEIRGCEVHLADGLGLVAGLAKDFRKGCDLRREGAAVIPAAVFVDVAARDERIAGRGADREGAEAVGVPHPVRSKLFDVGSLETTGEAVITGRSKAIRMP